MSDTENTIQAPAVQVLAPEVLASFHQRRTAGESLSALAREVGMTWQRLWVLLVSTQPKEMLPAVAGLSCFP